MHYTTTIASPIGALVLVSDGAALTALLFEEERGAGRLPGPRVPAAEAAPFPQARRELEEYFAGARTAFGIALAPSGTPFQRRVWEALRHVPHGATATYRQIAQAAGSPRAFRAVGAALGRNPIAIVVPCHRIIGADGTLTGYAGGITRKKALLDLEAGRRATAAPRSSGPPAAARQRQERLQRS